MLDHSGVPWRRMKKYRARLLESVLYNDVVEEFIGQGCLRQAFLALQNWIVCPG